MGTVDLDKARAARREAKKKGPVVRFGGRNFTLPVELPFEVIEAFGPLLEAQQKGDVEGGAATAGAVLHVIKALLGESYKEFMANRPSMDDLNVFVSGVLAEYGLADSPNSPASGS